MATEPAINRETYRAMMSALPRSRSPVLNALSEGVIIVDAAGEFLFANDAAERMGALALVGRSDARAVSEAGTPMTPAQLPIVRARAGDLVDGQPYRIVDDRCSERRLITSVRPLDHAGEEFGYILTTRDATEQSAAEQALRMRGATLETLNRVGAQLAGELDVDRIVQAVTDASTELVGAQFGAFFYRNVDAAGEAYMLFALSGARPDQFDFGMPRMTAVFHPSFSGENVVRSDDILSDPRYGRSGPHFGMPRGHLPVRSYLSVPVVGRGRNPIGALLFGHEEPGRFHERHENLLQGIAAQAAVAIDNARLFDAARTELESRIAAESELVRLNETLETRVEEESRRRAEAEETLRQAQKMETIGQLTGGIAHDFNNLLQVIAGNLDLVLARLPDDPRLRRSLENARKGAERASILTQRLLAFSRRQKLAPRPVDANRLIADMLDLLHRSIGETIIVETRADPALCTIEVDPNQLENALLNLAVNARDAMPEGGRLVIETRAMLRDGARAAAITVRDTGTGMDDATLTHVFEPFFTTKDVGKGTGLGLSMVYGFAHQSGGEVEIESKPGKGTVVSLIFPAVDALEAEPAPPAIPASVPLGAGETILVCEDDDDVRRFTVTTLLDLGYDVLEASDGEAALRLLADGGAAPRLLFTDVVLPGALNGEQLAAAALRLRPDLKLLFTSGYPRDAISHGGRLDADVELLTKPFRPADLATKLRELLAAEIVA